MRNESTAAAPPRRRDYLKKIHGNVLNKITVFSLCLVVPALNIFAQQEQPPAPGAPRAAQIPAVKERKLANGLTVAVVERRGVPLVTAQLLIRRGAVHEKADKAGLANLTANLLTKGTATRTATQIAEEIEFLGGSINTGAGWNSSSIVVGAMSDKIDKALAVMSDVVLNPAFKQEEIDLLKSQTLDGLTYNLRQPAFLANYAASRYAFGEHPAGGTPDSLKSISRADIAAFHKSEYAPNNAVLIFAGNISEAGAVALAQKFFGEWKKRDAPQTIKLGVESVRAASGRVESGSDLKRILVIDLSGAGQASVNYLKRASQGRVSCASATNCETVQPFYWANVLNSLLGGGYSSRLNQEIRIKRGLSYGAGSGFAWRDEASNFSTRTQTKNESAAEVAELVLAEVKRLTAGSIAEAELAPRKSVLTGNFGRNLETTGGLAAQVADLYSFGLPAGELNSYMQSVQKVSDKQIRDFAGENLMGGDLIIVGDYAKFKDDLAKRFPNVAVEVVKADELDVSRPNLRKSN